MTLILTPDAASWSNERPFPCRGHAEQDTGISAYQARRAKKLAQHQTHLGPRAKKLTQHQTRLGPRAKELAQHQTHLGPHAKELAQHQAHLGPRAKELAQHAINRDF